MRPEYPPNEWSNINLSKEYFTLRCKNQRKTIKVDRNVNYGLYYTEDGERIDQRVIEISHTNDYYNK